MSHHVPAGRGQSHSPPQSTRRNLPGRQSCVHSPAFPASRDIPLELSRSPRAQFPSPLFLSSIASPHKPAQAHPWTSMSSATQIQLSPIRSAIPTRRQSCFHLSFEPAQRVPGNTVYSRRRAPPPAVGRRLKSSSPHNQFRPWAQRRRSAAFLHFSPRPQNAVPDSRLHPMSPCCAAASPAGSGPLAAPLLHAGSLHKPPPAPAVRFAILRRQCRHPHRRKVAELEDMLPAVFAPGRHLPKRRTPPA